MLYGFYMPTKGDVLWNGVSYSKYQISTLRSHFGVVEQFPFLFNGTIEENISLFGQYSFAKDELKNTFQGFNLIESLLNQSHYSVSERGGNLSMGQKQMITFLRAYVSNPDIWILDEATAFFDPEAEGEVLRALENLREKQITVIQVAHRPEALRGMSRLLQIG
jgi:ABC-type multidrug transport system fused ATPase/permease subunit